MTRLILTLLLAAGLHAAGNPAASRLNCFAIRTYGELAPGSGNLILSPYSISAALSMALAGARGQTAAEMFAVLGQSGAVTDYHQGIAALAAGLVKAGNTAPNELLLANGLWAQNGFPALPEFRRTIEGTYNAPLNLLDFRGDLEGARARINSWTERQTKSRIRDLFGPGSLDATTRLILTSAIYFNGKWQSAFRAAGTRPAPFHVYADRSVQTSFMHQTARFGYAEAPEVQILEMRYAGSTLAFDVLLPRSADGLPELERSLTAGKLAAWFAGLQKREVEVSLPKFRAEAEFSLRSVLSRLGMSTAFTAAADFSGIDDRRDLMLSDVRHKAFVDVTEEGTEAAAATGAVVALVAMQAPVKVVFRADHPFSFMIRDTGTGTLLFAGRYAKPRS